MNIGRSDSQTSANFDSVGLISISGVSCTTLIEYGVTFCLVCTAFVYSTYHFLNESIDVLVPFSSVSACSSYTEVTNLVPQTIERTYPATLVFVNYGTGLVYPGYANATFSARWSSCLQESNDNSVILVPENDENYLPVNISLINDLTQTIYGTAYTNNDCFALYCEAVFTYVYDLNFQKNYDEFLDDSIFIVAPYNKNVLTSDNNGTKLLTNSQLISTIFGTNTSVTASCGISLGGYYISIFTQSNSVSATGTYLCTQKTDTFEALSSGLSLALTALGICRLYFYGKAFIRDL